MSIDRTMTIAEMATAFGVSHRSLRFYEEKSLLRPSRRGTARFYGPTDAVRLQLILKGKKLGFSLEEISRLILAHETPRADTDDADATAYLSGGQIAAQLVTLEAERGRIDEAIVELRRALERNRQRCEPSFA